VVFNISNYEANFSVHPQGKVLELYIISAKSKIIRVMIFIVISFVNPDLSKMPVKYDTQQETQLGIL